MVRSVAEMFSLPWKQVFNVAPTKAEEHLEFPIGTKILEVMELGDIFMFQRENHLNFLLQRGGLLVGSSSLHR